MRDLNTATTDNRKAMADYGAVLEGIDIAAWPTPVGPGKWSPAQITDHLSITFELGAGLVEGKPEIPGVPWIMRAAIRTLFLPRILKSGRFPRGGKTSDVFQPGKGSATPREGQTRLEAAVGRFESAVRASADSGKDEFAHPVFGAMTLADYMRLQEIHILHHLGQLPGATSGG